MRAISIVVLGCVVYLSGCSACRGSSVLGGPRPVSMPPVTAWLDVEGMDVAAEVTVGIVVHGPLAREGQTVCYEWENQARLEHCLILLLADEKPESFRGSAALDKLATRIAEAFYAELGGPHSGWGIKVLFEKVMLYDRGAAPPPDPYYGRL